MPQLFMELKPNNASILHFTAMACQKRWRYLRDYFVRQLHTLPESKLADINSSTNNGKKKTLWFLYDRLKFLAPFSSTRRGRSKLENQDPSQEFQAPQSVEELNSANSLSSNNSGQNSYELNYLQLLQYQQQLGDYLRSSDADADNALSDRSTQEMIVDVDQYDDEDEQEEQVEGEEDEEAISGIQQTERSVANSLEDSTTPSLSTSNHIHKHCRSDGYNELLDLLRTQRHEMELDEHEHFFKSLLASVRKIDEDHIMSFRTEVMQIVTKYLYMNNSGNAVRAREEPSQIVVIETDQLHWRKNLRKYKV